MKGGGSSALVTSFAAAQTVVASYFVEQQSQGADGKEKEKEKQKQKQKQSDDQRFTPRFDGLRFIETLVTAHR